MVSFKQVMSSKCDQKNELGAHMRVNNTACGAHHHRHSMVAAARVTLQLFSPARSPRSTPNSSGCVGRGSCPIFSYTRNKRPLLWSRDFELSQAWLFFLCGRTHSDWNEAQNSHSGARKSKNKSHLLFYGAHILRGELSAGD